MSLFKSNPKESKPGITPQQLTNAYKSIWLVYIFGKVVDPKVTDAIFSLLDSDYREWEAKQSNIATSHGLDPAYPLRQLMVNAILSNK